MHHGRNNKQLFYAQHGINVDSCCSLRLRAVFLFLAFSLHFLELSSREKRGYGETLPLLIPSLFLSVICIIIHMKKLLDSDWLRALQFKCNTSAKSVTPVQITNYNSG